MNVLELNSSLRPRGVKSFDPVCSISMKQLLCACVSLPLCAFVCVCFKYPRSTKRWRERGGDGTAGRKEGTELTVADVFVLQGGERGDEGWELSFSPSVCKCVCVCVYRGIYGLMGIKSVPV